MRAATPLTAKDCGRATHSSAWRTSIRAPCAARNFPHRSEQSPNSGVDRSGVRTAVPSFPYPAAPRQRASAPNRKSTRAVGEPIRFEARAE